MIEVTGELGSSEHNAALRIAEKLAALWPGLKNSPASREMVRIAANVKLSGYRVSDVDVVIVAVLHDRKYIPTRPVAVQGGGSVSGRPVAVRNFIAAIEVKDHDASAVNIVGDKILVHYTSRGRSQWSSATDQNIAQVHSLADYFGDWLRERPFIHRCVLMQGLASIDVGGAVSQDYSGIGFMSALAATSSLYRGPAGLTFSSGPDDVVRRSLRAPLFVPVVPTALDRQRMDAITAGSPSAEQVFSELGKRLIWLRGHGGTGKTVLLLHAAWRAYRERGSRTLVLTYNHALAADIRRLLSLMKGPVAPEQGGVKVQTVMAFLSGWMRRLGIEDSEEVPDDGYEARCNQVLEHIREGAITGTDIDSVIEKDGERYDFDFIVVDEAQDWPQAEADLLKALYGPQRIALADGIDQLVRMRIPTDWRRGVEKSGISVIPLTECLRMKRNLAVFANRLFRAASLPWAVDPCESAGGGRVLVLTRPIQEQMQLVRVALDDAKSKGNDAVDILHCVPTSDVETVDGRRRSRFGSELVGAGYSVWDGTDEVNRKDYPRMKEQFRVVHYASCRGLEGWAVFLHGVDEFWAECFQVRSAEGLTSDEELALKTLTDVAEEYAWRRLMIALTRPIDNLVLSLADTQSPVSRAILAAGRQCPDFVTIIGGD